MSEMVEEISEKLVERSESFDAPQLELDAQGEALRRRKRTLREWERTRKNILDPTLERQPEGVLAGMKPCQRGSGLKFKRCHGRLV